MKVFLIILALSAFCSGQDKECHCINGYCEEENGQQKCICNPEYGPYGLGKCKACNCGKGANCTFDKGFFTDITICICPKGYMNKDEKCVVDLCAVNPCKNGGTCENDGNNFKCSCKHPYSGENCEVNNFSDMPTLSVTYEEQTTLSTFCEPNPCQNGGHCVSEDQKFYCLCPKDYFGMLCESKIPDASTVLPSSVTFEEQSTLSTICEPNPCQNGGHCFSGNQKFYCLCPENYFGMLCEYSKIGESVTYRPQTSPFSRFTETLPVTRTVSRFTSPAEFSKTPRYRTSTRFPTTPGCRCINGYCVPDNTYGNWKCVCKPDYGLYGDGICIPCNCGPDSSCKFERNELWLKKQCICQRGFQDRNGTCVELCNPRTCIHGQCEISDPDNFCRCDVGYKGVHCNEKIEKIMDEKIVEILEIQAPWILLTVLLLILLIAVIVINRNKNIKKNSFFFLNSDEKCPLFEDSKFVNRLQTEVLE